MRGGNPYVHRKRRPIPKSTVLSKPVVALTWVRLWRRGGGEEWGQFKAQSWQKAQPTILGLILLEKKVGEDHFLQLRKIAKQLLCPFFYLWRLKYEKVKTSVGFSSSNQSPKKIPLGTEYDSNKRTNSTGTC